MIQKIFSCTIMKFSHDEKTFHMKISFDIISFSAVSFHKPIWMSKVKDMLGIWLNHCVIENLIQIPSWGLWRQSPDPMFSVPQTYDTELSCVHFFSVSLQIHQSESSLNVIRVIGCRKCNSSVECYQSTFIANQS